MSYEIEPLTKEESKWLKDFQKLMNKCPTHRFGAYTTGDNYLAVYDKPVFDEYRESLAYMRDQKDDVTMHDDIDSVFLSITMPFQVDGVAG